MCDDQWVAKPQGLVNERARIVGNKQVGPRLYLMTLHAPVIQELYRCGQFVHLQVPGMEGHILRRPFSVYDQDMNAGTIDVLYQTVGFGTDRMTALAPGQEIDLIGPVGHRWNVPDEAERVLLVGGGVGAAPLYTLAWGCVCSLRRVDVVLGAQTKDALVCRERYASLLSSAAAKTGGCDPEPRCATDDGTFGRAGFCTSLVEEALSQAKAEGAPYGYVATCGPEPLMRIVARMAADAGVPCEVSLEKRMACGIGACLSCVVETKAGKKRSCVDGPVFDAAEVVW